MLGRGYEFAAGYMQKRDKVQKPELIHRHHQLFLVVSRPAGALRSSTACKSYPVSRVKDAKSSPVTPRCTKQTQWKENGIKIYLKVQTETFQYQQARSYPTLGRSHASLCDLSHHLRSRHQELLTILLFMRLTHPGSILFKMQSSLRCSALDLGVEATPYSCFSQFFRVLFSSQS